MSESPGTIITFYSYKGGTGRSMALANVAWLLAENGMRVLVIDWDLEAPGLHRYFHPFLIDPELSDTPGLIDFFWSYASHAMTPPERESSDGQSYDDVADITGNVVQLDWGFQNNGVLDFIPAGRQDAEYAERVNSFDWNNFYTRLDGEILLERVRSCIRDQYDYILIDSRTGVSDTSGICTVAMPDRLVAMFTLNTQSIEGVAAILDSIATQRSPADVEFYPIICRVELAEKERLEAARRRARRLFSRFLVTSRSSRSRDYWSDAEVLYQPYYAYEEILATFGDPTGSDYSESSLLASMERLTQQITGIDDLEMPTIPARQRESVLRQFAGTDATRRTNQQQTEAITEDPEERKARASQYSDKLLDAAAKDAGQAQRKSRIVLVLTIAAGIGITASQGFLMMPFVSQMENPMASRASVVCAILGAMITVSKVLGTRTILSYQRLLLESALEAPNINQAIGRPSLLRFARLIPLTAAAVVCALQIWLPLHETQLLFGVGITVGLGLLVLILEAIGLLQNPDGTFVRKQWLAQAIEREQRLYTFLSGAYTDIPEGPLAYRRFKESVERIIDIGEGR